MNNAIFCHQCLSVDCDVVVQYDDEPYCFVHSPDEGSDLPGFSARETLALRVADLKLKRDT